MRSKSRFSLFELTSLLGWIDLLDLGLVDFDRN